MAERRRLSNLSPIDHLVEKAAQQIDEIIAHARDEACAMLELAGASDDEFEIALAGVDAMHAEGRSKALANVRAWLERGGETAH